MKLLLTLLLAAIVSLSAPAQSLAAADLLHPPADSWPGYHGDSSGRRHSPLTQIKPANVGSLGLAWAFQTNQGAQIKSSPLVVDGVLYFTVPDNIWAVDARSGHTLWHYTYPPNKGSHIGHRGVAMVQGWLFFVTPDCHLVSLNAKDGTVRWNIVIADVEKGYWMTLAPLVVKNHVIVGVSGDFDNLTGYLQSIDPETGHLQWQWGQHSAPRNPRHDHRRHHLDDRHLRSRAHLIFWGTGNPTPVLNGTTRPGNTSIPAASLP